MLKLKEQEDDERDTNSDEEWIRVSDSDEVQKLITERNLHHFNQASKTPINDPPHYADFCRQFLRANAPHAWPLQRHL